MEVLVAEDWRSSASILGLTRYFDYYGIEYNEDDDSIEYDPKTITLEKYIKFAEYYYSYKMYHVVALKLIEKSKKNKLTKEEKDF